MHVMHHRLHASMQVDTRKRVRSRGYHKGIVEAKAMGLDEEQQKEYARKKASEAVQEWLLQK